LSGVDDNKEFYLNEISNKVDHQNFINVNNGFSKIVQKCQSDNDNKHGAVNLIKKMISEDGSILWLNIFIATYEYWKLHGGINYRIALADFWNSIVCDDRLKSNIEIREASITYIGKNKLWNFRFYNMLLKAQKDAQSYIQFLFHNSNPYNISFKYSKILADVFIKDINYLAGRSLALFIYINHNDGDNHQTVLEVLERIKLYSLSIHSLLHDEMNDILDALGYKQYDCTANEIRTLYSVVANFSDILNRAP